MQRSRAYTYMVWAHPFSIASTGGIDVSFFSCRYLDGSVPCVPCHTLWIHAWLTWIYHVSFPNLGDFRISDRLRLPGNFRSFATSFVGSWCLGILTYTLSSLILFSLEISTISFHQPSLSKNTCQGPSRVWLYACFLSSELSVREKLSGPERTACESCDCRL